MFFVMLFFSSSLLGMHPYGLRSFVFDGQNHSRSEQRDVLDELQDAPSDLQVLVLTNMQIGRLPSKLKRFKHLREVSFANNCLKDGRVCAIGHLENLEVVDLSGNLLEHVPVALTRLSELHTLNLADNRLASAKAAWQKLEALETLDLASNDIEEIDASMAKLPELETLILDGNLLSSLPLTLAHMARLRKLTLTHNCFSMLPPVINCMRDGGIPVHVIESEDEELEREHPDDIVIHYNQVTQHRAPKKVHRDRLV